MTLPLLQETYEQGEPGTQSWRLFFKQGGKNISPWHDLPISTKAGEFIMVNEIPRGYGG